MIKDPKDFKDLKDPKKMRNLIKSNHHAGNR
jgi:hypothetical protein